MKQEITLGLAPLETVDSGAISSCGRIEDPLICIGDLSTKQFQVPTGQVVPSTKSAKLHYNV